MKTKILLVDDEIRILQTFARTLRLEGYAVLTAEDGEEGLTLLSWPKIPSVSLDNSDERESECRRLFVAKKSAREVAKTSRFRRFDASLGSI